MSILFDILADWQHAQATESQSRFAANADPERARSMSEKDQTQRIFVQRRHSLGAAVLAESAVSQVSTQQLKTSGGARQFIVDHMIRAILSRGEFGADALLDELRGHRLSVDAIIDVYVPASARCLGEMWLESQVDFASVTVGSMRLQTLLSLASAESLEFAHSAQTTIHALVVVPESGNDVDKQGLLEYFDGKVAKWWIPDDVQFVEEIPHTATGKISKLQLRQQFTDYEFPDA